MTRDTPKIRLFVEASLAPGASVAPGRDKAPTVNGEAGEWRARLEPANRRGAVITRTEKIRARLFARPVSLGSRILRADPAAHGDWR